MAATTNLKKPRQRIVVPSGALPATPAGLYTFSTLYSTRATLLMAYAQASLAGQLLMRAYTIGDDGRKYGLTLEDGTVTSTANGFETPVEIAVKRFTRTAADELLSYTFDVDCIKWMAVQFWEEGAAGGELEVWLQTREA